MTSKESQATASEPAAGEAAVNLEQSRLEEALKASERRYRFLMDNTPAALSVVVGGKIVFANSRVEKILGFSPEELKRLDGFTVIHPDDRERVRDLHRLRTQGENTPSAYTLRVIRKDGETIWLRRRAVPIAWEGAQAVLVMDVDVTDRMQAEAKLEQATAELKRRNAFIQAVIDKLPIGLAINSIGDGKAMYVNRKFEEIYGWPKEDIVDVENFFNIVYPDPEYRKGIKARVMIDIQSGDLSRMTWDNLRATTKTGEVHIISAANIPIPEQNIMVSTVRDITARKKAEDHLADRNALLTSIFQSVPNVMLLVDSDGRVTDINRAGINFADKPKAALLGLLGGEIFNCLNSFSGSGCGKNPECSSCSVRTRVQRTFDTQEAIHDEEGELQVQHRGKTVTMNILISTAPINTPLGKQVLVSVMDITERKAAEKALLHAAQEWRATFDSIKDMVAIVDANHTISRVNRAFAETLGMKPEQLVGQHCYSVIHGMNQPHPMCPHSRTLQSKHVESSEYFDKNLKIWVEASASPIFDEDGKLSGSVHIIKDISARKAAEEEQEVLRHKAEVSGRLAAIGEMAAGIAHEINNPLTGVIGFSELLMERTDIPNDVKEDLTIINQGSQRVKDIVRRMLTFARQTKPQKSAVDISELLDSALELRRYVLETANISVVKEYDQELPWVSVDARQLQQVFLNLIVNAEYSMKKSKGRGILRLKTERRGEMLRISVADDGLGLTAEDKAKLFQPFFTTKEPGQGTGLGLALSMGIIKEHGGTISAEGAPGQGATFTIDLPLAAAEIEPAAPELPAMPAGAKANILVVDDEPTVRLLIRMILTQDGHKVVEADGPQAALQELAAGPYDLTFIDIRMPDMSGMELYRVIGERWPEMTARVVFITGDTSDKATREYLDKHNVPYIAKPFDRRQLEEVCRRLLNGKAEQTPDA